MALRVETRDGTPERRVLIGCIVSKIVLAPVADRWKHGLFASKYANLVGGWCVQHYREYRDAPGAAIEDYYNEWAATGGKDRETADAVGALLANLSHEAARLKRDVSLEYLLDVAGDLFERVRLRELAQKVEAHLERGETDEARTLVESSRRIEIGMGAGVEVLMDRTAMDAAFEHRNEILISIPGALGGFYGEALARQKFLAFLGKEKVGKSYFVRDLVWRAVERNLNVAYFELGDDVQENVLIRFAERATGRSSKSDRYERPLAVESRTDEPPDVRSQWGKDDPPLDAAETFRVFEEHNPNGRFKVSCHAAGTLSVAGAETILDGWMRDGWAPDVVAFDYADLLKIPGTAKDDKLEGTNSAWMDMRGLSQKLHCLVVTATQCNREGFDVRVLRREHVGGFHMKLAHVTDMVGINQTAKEKQRNLYRLNRIVGRQLTFGEDKLLWCVSCLAVANPCVLATF